MQERGAVDNIWCSSKVENEKAKGKQRTGERRASLQLHRERGSGRETRKRRDLGQESLRNIPGILNWRGQEGQGEEQAEMKAERKS